MLTFGPHLRSPYLLELNNRLPDNEFAGRKPELSSGKANCCWFLMPSVHVTERAKLSAGSSVSDLLRTGFEASARASADGRVSFEVGKPPSRWRTA
jgi:hypothetical protein